MRLLLYRMSIVNDYMFSLLNHMRIIAGVDKERVGWLFYSNFRAGLL